jgi:hypothetical protein
MATRRIDAGREIERRARAPLPDPDGLALTESPVDLPDPAQPLPAPLRWTTEAILAATLVLALFNATAIRGWANQLGSNDFTARVVIAVEGWYHLMDLAGLNRPVAATHAGWQSVKDLRFGRKEDQPPPPP